MESHREQETIRLEALQKKYPELQLLTCDEQRWAVWRETERKTFWWGAFWFFAPLSVTAAGALTWMWFGIPGLSREISDNVIAIIGAVVAVISLKLCSRAYYRRVRRALRDCLPAQRDQ